jgi:hypothetical protein
MDPGSSTFMQTGSKAYAIDSPTFYMVIEITP